jgi:hypothetical protein
VKKCHHLGPENHLSRWRCPQHIVRITLKEASSWGKVDTTYEQMVYCEATIAVPLIAGYA